LDDYPTGKHLNGISAQVQSALVGARAHHGEFLDISTKAIVDTGCTFFVSPRRELFIESTLKATKQIMRGFDGKDAPLLMEGIASMVFKDPRSKILYRFTVPGLLSSSGNTLISANQLKRQDGIGYSVPGDESPSSL
jgi:hypothetical protein